MEPMILVRVIWVAMLAGLAALALFRVPLGVLWMPAVAATEAGYLLALLGLPVFAAGLATPRDRVLAALTALAMLALLSSLARAPAVAATLPSRLTGAFGPAAAPEEGRAAFAMTRLLDLGHPDVPVETHIYAHRGGNQPLSLDLYGRPGAVARPLVVMIHGGSWSRGDRTQLPGMARRLAARGYAVASIDYRLAPTHPFPSALEDVREAVDFLRAEADTLGIDPHSVVLYGRSAGGHLALLAAYRWNEPFVRGVVSLYAPTDLHWSWANPTNPRVLDTHGTLRAFLGGAPDDSPELHARYTEASPIGFVHHDAPPTLLVHGSRDELVNPKQTSRLAQTLARAGVPHVALALPWATHGCEASLGGPSGQLVETAVRGFLQAVAPAARGSAAPSGR